MQLMMWLGLFCLEISLIIEFYVVPQYQARNAPVGHWELESPLHDGPGLWVVLIAYMALFIVGNVGLIVVIWRQFRNLKVND